MSDSVSPYRSIKKSALAALLGIPDEQLLTRDEAADEIGVSPGYLANLAKPDAKGVGGGPAYYRSTTSPTGGTAWYPTSEVGAFKHHRRSKITRSYERKTGQQNWTKLQDDVERLPVHTVVSMIEEWRDNELYRRAQAILHDPNPMAGRATYEEECRLFGAAHKDGRVEAFAAIAGSDDAAAQRKAIFESLDDQTNAVEAHLLALTASRGLSVSSAHPSFFVLTTMFERAWGEVLAAETRWRNFDYTGMPKHRPSAINEITISVGRNA
ncbi:hypothetical protein ASF31_05640 [Brevundimonas sp. Leaf280]|uniref:hypothetical protein n=1 Tax=Brevundimonas sp. Leaf280 TaxID=1736320 RepID=UPI0006F1D8F5|nr:hypothetical protein [Brevundimonas sp. Leaf280]KQP46690.1 hypothetical protein ASF31_05640 [Brevundimonas sp. Leaf280]